MKMNRTHLLILACISISSHALAQDSYTILAANKSNLTISSNECIEASHENLLQVTPMGNTNNRYFQIKQFSDSYQYNYGYTLKEQISERKIFGKRICHGVVTLSNMELPFAKTTGGIADVNDGILLVETMQKDMNEIKESLNKMRIIAENVSVNNYTSSQLGNFDLMFQDLSSGVNRIANVSQFNGIGLLDGNMNNIDVPTDHANSKIQIHLSNLTTGASGLNIVWFNVNSKEEANVASNALLKIIDTLNQNIKQLEAKKLDLKIVADRLSVITSIDLNGDIFTIKRYPKNST